MSALNNLIQFAERLDGELLADFQQRVNAYMDERDRLQNERIGQSMARLGTFEVVAIAGTAETLLTEINVGDTVELRNSDYNPPNEIRDLDLSFNKVYLVDDTYIDVEGTSFVTVEGNSNEILAKRFRKVSTPSINPHQPVSGC